MLIRACTLNRSNTVHINIDLDPRREKEKGQIENVEMNHGRGTEG